MDPDFDGVTQLIIVSNSSLVLRDLELDGEQVVRGVVVKNSDLTLDQVEVQDVSGVAGSAVDASATTLSVLRSTLRAGTAMAGEESPAGLGGLIRTLAGSVSIEESVLEDGIADLGGLVYSVDSVVDIVDSQLVGGNATEGAALAVAEGSVTLTRTVICRHTGDSGVLLLIATSRLRPGWGCAPVDALAVGGGSALAPPWGPDLSNGPRYHYAAGHGGIMGYGGERYLDMDEVDAAIDALAAQSPDWVSVSVIGTSRQGRPIRLVTVGDHTSGDPDDRPTLWLDGGTHAVEWTGVMSAMVSLTRWVDGLEGGDASLRAAFRRHTVVCVPCISPDGLQQTMHGEPFFRSTVREARPGVERIGFEPCDVDGDGLVRWMRWRDPAGGWVPDGAHPVLMRPRTVDDDPADAFFFASEGSFLQWDGVRYIDAPLKYGLDLNRNFPVDWAPFSMFGMDAGTFPGSEPESRAVLDAVAARPHVAAGVTNHTYTGCLLTPPSRKDSQLPASDQQRMQRLALDLVEGTGYRTFKVYPEFMYDPDKPIIGTWDDTLSAVFGVCAYTLELWDPFAWAGLPHADPVAMFRDPDQERVRAIADKAVSEGAYQAWTPFEHPQLGPVEIGGLDYRRTVRNPPDALLPAECERGFTIADRLRRALPDVHATVTAEAVGDGTRVRLVLENRGALSTSGLQRAIDVGACPPVTATLEGAELVDGPAVQQLSHMDGWLRSGFGRNPVYPQLGATGHRVVATWLVRGPATGQIRWQAGRGGVGVVTVA